MIDEQSFTVGEAAAKNQRDLIRFAADPIVSATPAFSMLMGRKTVISSPTFSITTPEKIKLDFPMKCIVVDTGYELNSKCKFSFIFQEQDALVIADLMMGGDASDVGEEVNTIHLSAIGEAVSQMMGAASASLSSIINKKIRAILPQAQIEDFTSDSAMTSIVRDSERIISLKFPFSVDGIIDSEIVLIFPLEVAEEMISYMPDVLQGESAQNNPSNPGEQRGLNSKSSALSGATSQGGWTLATQMSSQANGDVVQPAMFAPLSVEPVEVNEANLGLLLDVPLRVTVELGRTRRSIKEVLELVRGSVIELNRLAGEAVDIHINGKLLAKGEVVVINENFGVRITEIVSPEERIASLQ